MSTLLRNENDCSFTPEAEDDLPTTEKSNLLSQDIDCMSAHEMVNVFDRIDHQIFAVEESGYDGILSEEVAEKVDQLCATLTDRCKADTSVKDPFSTKLIFSGCGTSGRLGFLTTCRFSRLFKTLNLRYIMAGGDQALFSSRELPEDDPEEGIQSLKEELKENGNGVFLGVSCGLSAPFVCGQLDHLLSSPQTRNVFPTLLGFNKISDARKEIMGNMKKSFQDIAREMEVLESKRKALVINPLIGPELLTGSSRMKGGTATKIILDSLMISLLVKLKIDLHSPYRTLAEKFKDSLRLAYDDKGTLSRIIAMAGDSLKACGHLYYVGYDSYGLYGLLDASECEPTFGATCSDVRGFISNGHSFFTDKNCDRCTYDTDDHKFNLSVGYFVNKIQPTLTKNDCVILIGSSAFKDKMECTIKAISVYRCSVGVVMINEGAETVYWNSERRNIPVLCIGENNMREKYTKLLGGFGMELYKSILELSVKLVLNVVSTGAFILYGKVLHNIMIDIRISNSKLYNRAVRIISRCTGLQNDKSNELLLCSLYRCNEPTNVLKMKSINSHVCHGRNVNKVVPIAIVMFLKKCGVVEAESALKLQPMIRRYICSLMEE